MKDSATLVEQVVLAAPEAAVHIPPDAPWWAVYLPMGGVYVLGFVVAVAATHMAKVWHRDSGNPKKGNNYYRVISMVAGLIGNAVALWVFGDVTQHEAWAVAIIGALTYTMWYSVLLGFLKHRYPVIYVALRVPSKGFNPEKEMKPEAVEALGSSDTFADWKGEGWWDKTMIGVPRETDSNDSK